MINYYLKTLRCAIKMEKYTVFLKRKSTIILFLASPKISEIFLNSKKQIGKFIFVVINNYKAIHFRKTQDR